MNCPFCNHLDTQVKDSRSAEDNAAIRRRRFCTQCNGRFTTIERVQLRELTVIKKDGTLVPFRREKLEKSLFVALHKRPIEASRVHTILNSIVRQLEASGETEISSNQIGEMIMDVLSHLDLIAYVRFASVYQGFQWPKDFEDFVKRMKEKNRKSVPESP